MTAPRAASVGLHAPSRAHSMPPPRSFPGRTSLDPDSRTWLHSLNSDGRVRDEAIARLHALLLRAARFEVARRRAASPHWDGEDLDDIALQSADDALVAVLAKLHDFRGHSRFTTWAFKFALLETAVKMRRRPWQGRELPLEPERWPHIVDRVASPAADAEQGELLAAVRDAIDEELTPHQREVLVAVALNGVPIDVLAERLGTTRGALYKTIHDARRKLRRRLVADDQTLEPAPREMPQ
jgi:RNA polymerase sigma-70 factor (ECF subfamily)